ncbi:hypothetical protein ACMFMG_010646 [Clarireedia jacksonii]
MKSLFFRCGLFVSPKWRVIKPIIARIISNWWLELLAGILVIFSFSGLVAILRRYQNQPLPDWPLGFSINAALSVFGVIFKGPLLFIAAEGIGQMKWLWLSQRRSLSDLSVYDNASRGPSGSIRLLWLVRWRHRTAMLGALITVVALGVDPFSQAIVSYYSCNIKVTQNLSPATISRTNSLYNEITPGEDLSTEAKVLIDGSFSDSTTLMPNYTCPSTSCSFPPYYSIGFCSRCIDVTDLLETTCYYSKDYTTSDWELCNYTLPAGGTRIAGGFGSVNTTANIVMNPTFYKQCPFFSVNKFELTFNQSTGQIIQPSPRSLNTSSETTIIDIVSAAPIFGYRCSVYYCVKKYTASIDSGKLNETLQSTSSNWSSFEPWDAPVLGTVNVGCLTPQVQARLLSDGYISIETNWMAWNGTYLNGTESQENISESEELAIPVSCAYQARTIDADFAEVFKMPLGEAYSNIMSGALTAWVNSATKPSFDSTFQHSSVLLQLFNNGSSSIDYINNALNNFTTVITNYMRTLSNLPIPSNSTVGSAPLGTFPNFTVGENHVPGKPQDWNQPVIGEAFTNTTCIRVRWPWLALPVTLVIGILVFLLALIVQTADENGLEIWKSSQDALLWHGLDEHLKLEAV